MRIFFLGLVSIISLNVFSFETMPYLAPYVIVSDVFDSTLPTNACVVFGLCVLQSGTPLQNGTVATLNRTAQSISDIKGNY